MMKKRLSIATIAALALGVVFSVPASAYPIDGPKVYRHLKVYPNRGGLCGGPPPTSANLEVNNYPSGSVQIYAMDMDGDTSASPDITSFAIYLKAPGSAVWVKQTKTQTFSVQFANENAKYDIKGTWRQGICDMSVTIWNT